MISNRIKQESAVEGRLLLFWFAQGAGEAGLWPARSRHKLHFLRQLFQQAVRQAAAGDASAISGMLQGIMSTPQGAALVQRIGESLQK